MVVRPSPAIFGVSVSLYRVGYLIFQSHQTPAVWMAPPAKSSLPASPAAAPSPSLISAASPSSAAQLIQSIPPGKHRRGWDAGIPPILRPLVRAYLLGYASTVAPRLASLLIQHLTRLFKKHYDTPKQEASSTSTKQQSTDTFLASLIRTLKGGFDWHRFPTFCALLAGGSTLLEVCNIYATCTHLEL